MEATSSPQDGGNKLPAVNTVIVTAQMNVALTQNNLSVQKVQDEINSLVINEDNLQNIAEVLKKLNYIDKIIETKHKEGKSPYLEAGKAWDAAKNGLLSITELFRKQLLASYNKLCADIDKRKRDAEAESKRKKDIQDGIENNVIKFSGLIANCENNEQLLSVERNINLEKSPSRKDKYAEFQDYAINRYDTVLIPIIKSQKEKIKQKEAISKQLLEAENNDDAAKVEELKGKQEEIDNEILQNQVDVQQNAISQMSINIPDAEEVLPKIKPVDTVKFEIADISVAVKKSKELLDISIRFRDCQKIAMALKDAGTFDNKDEVIVNGIRFFIDKSFRL